MTLSAFLCLAALAAAGTKPPEPEIRASIQFPRMLELVRKPGSPTAVIAGVQKVSFGRPTTGGDFVRRPVLRLTVLCDNNGDLECRTCLVDRFDTYERMNPSQVSEAYRNAGRELKGSDRKAALSDPAQFTPLLSTVGCCRLSKPCFYGNVKDRSGGFFRVSRLTGDFKVLVTRMEIWQNGVMIAREELAASGFKRSALPKDWFEWKRHPEMFRYVESS